MEKPDIITAASGLSGPGWSVVHNIARILQPWIDEVHARVGLGGEATPIVREPVLMTGKAAVELAAELSERTAINLRSDLSKANAMVLALKNKIERIQNQLAWVEHEIAQSGLSDKNDLREEVWKLRKLIAEEVTA